MHPSDIVNMGAVCKAMTYTTDSNTCETTLCSTEIYNGSIIRVTLDDVQMPNGKVGKREVVEHPGGVVVLAELDNGKILLIRQFRYPLGHDLYEFPAGKLDPGEDPLTSIRRELEEETGYTADVWELLTHVYTSPGFCNERLTLFRATGLRKSENPRREEDECIEVMEETVEELWRLIREQKIVDAKTICTLSLVYPMERIT
jgi:ADP-ribose pyrophosphatase